MTGDVAESLAAMLQNQPHLKALNLNDTSLQDAGVSTIAQALANSGIVFAKHQNTLKAMMMQLSGQVAIMETASPAAACYAAWKWCQSS